MAIGRTFAESLQKALRSLEIGLEGLDEIHIPELDEKDAPQRAIRVALARPTPDRIRMIAQGFRVGLRIDEIHAVTRYDPWFLEQIRAIVAAEAEVRRRRPARRARRPARTERRWASPTPRPPCRDQRGHGRGAPQGRGRPSGVQADRHLRCRVRGAHAVPVQLALRPGSRAVSARNAKRRRARGAGDHLGGGPNRIEPGHRVRLLLRARRVRSRGRGHRDHHDQLQSRDGLDRLRPLPIGCISSRSPRRTCSRSCASR